MLCNVCSHFSEPFAKAKILGKYDTVYYQCTNCDFIQTESPYWLEEAYINPINFSDVGLVGRNIKFAQITKALITTFFGDSGEFVDYGGGYGLFVRLMRDKGIRFYLHDPLCQNLFAMPFSVDPPRQKRYDLVTAFEVFEHLYEPLDEVQNMLDFAPSIFSSTILMPPDRREPQDWWYYGLDHGQHVSIYSRKSLEIISESFGLHLYTNGHSFHFLSHDPISPFRFRLAISDKFSRLLNMLVRYPTLVPEDYHHITGRNL